MWWLREWCAGCRGSLIVWSGYPLERPSRDRGRRCRCAERAPAPTGALAIAEKSSLMGRTDRQYHGPRGAWTGVSCSLDANPQPKMLSLLRSPRVLEVQQSAVPSHFRRSAIALIIRPSTQKRPEQFLVIKRSINPHDPWSGNIALPGGRAQDTDASDAETASREAMEECGVDLSNADHFTPIGRIASDRTIYPRWLLESSCIL